MCDTARAELLEVDGTDSSCAEGFAMGRVRAAETQDEADAHVRQQVRVEICAEEAAVAHVCPLAAGRDDGTMVVAKEELTRDDGAK